MGKPIKQSKGEIRATVDRVKFYVNNYEKVTTHTLFLLPIYKDGS